MGQALLVMDVQTAVVERYPDPDYLPRLDSVITGARAHGVPVIFVGVGFRDGFPEVSARNKMFGPMRARAASMPPGAAAAASRFHPSVAPVDGEVVVTKRRVSAFSGSDLEVVLRAGGIDRLVLTGIATSGVVLSTLRQAADLDHEVTVLADGCLDHDPEVHDVLVEKVFPAQAEVTTTASWLSALS